MTADGVPIGTLNWGGPLNADIVDLQTQVTANLDNLVWNVKNHGATGNGSTNDTSAVAATIALANAAGGGIVFFPAGTFLCNAGTLSLAANGVQLIGAGHNKTIVKKATNGVLLSISGPSTDTSSATHRKYCSVQNMALSGNSLTGNLLQLFYADNLTFRDVLFTSNADVMVDTAEFWDSRFDNCTFETCGGAADSVTPMVYLRNSAASSGFGFSADNVNQIYFVGCRFENFNNGAIRIEQGVNNTNNPNGVYLIGNKMETSALRGGSHLYAADECRAIFVNDLYCYAGGFFSGYSTAQNVINWAPQASVLRDVLIANGATATIGSGVDLFSGANSTARLDSVVGLYTTAPTGAHIFYEASSTANFQITNCYGSTGSQAGGTIPIRYEGQSPVKQIAAVPTDGAFTHTPVNGTFAVDTSATPPRLYVREGGVWVAASSIGDVQTFTSSGTWTKPTGAVSVTVIAIAGGGGGGSGAREPSGTVSSGGAGGGGGAFTMRTYPASILSATETVTVGTGGAGGAAVTTDGTVGNPGGNGSNSVFKASTFHVANSGALGGGGSTGAATGGAGGGGGNNGGAGASSSATGLVGSNGTSTGIGAPGGGSGGGVTTAPAASAGGAGGNVSSSGANVGGTAGTAGNAGGAGASTAAGYPIAGTGGGGGGSATAAVGGTGGAGGVYGAGGGGGGASLNGSNSGAGGAGAAGIVVVMTAA